MGPCIRSTQGPAANTRPSWSARRFRSKATGQGRYALYFGDTKANVYALDAPTGALLWQMQADTHPVARITGAPTLAGGRPYVPVSSVEEVPAQNLKYCCCTFRGSVVALDTKTGTQIWKSYTIPDPPKATRVNSTGAQLMGPAGAAVWSAPTIDLKRKAIYVATGNSYSDPADRHTDAIIAFDMETGSMRWSQQMTPGDGWNFSCINPNKASCPESQSEDADTEEGRRARPADRRAEVRSGARARSERDGQDRMADAGRAGRSAGWNQVGLGGGRRECVCRAIGLQRAQTGDWQRHVRSAADKRRKGVGRAGAETALFGQARLHGRADGGRDTDSRCGVFRLDGRPSARVRKRRRKSSGITTRCRIIRRSMA
jgi:hypothetical protein